MDTAKPIELTNTPLESRPTWFSLPGLPRIQCDAVALCPSPTPATQITMTSAGSGSLAAIDPTGNVWAWNNVGQWVNLHAHCDHLTADYGDLLCSTGTQRHLIYDYAASEFGTTGTTWSLVTNSTIPIVQIVSSSDDVYRQYGFVFAGQLSAQDSYGEHYTGSEFASFSLYYNGYYGGIQQQGPLQEWWINPSDAFQSWNETPPVGRLVSGGAVFATNCSGLTSTCASF